MELSNLRGNRYSKTFPSHSDFPFYCHVQTPNYENEHEYINITAKHPHIKTTILLTIRRNFYFAFCLVSMRSLPLLAFLAVFLLLAPGAMACKDIIATDDATAGNYSLLLKVRDPSRPGLQVLCMVNRSYEYNYHTPWTGRDMHFITQHKFIGVATKGDVPPNIVKMGMAFSDAGIAYGDADVPSYKINPTRNAWDDFDWIRYACQNASTEDEAVDLLIEVVTMHAPAVAENLFVVGPQKAFVVEANAMNYAVTEINGLSAMSNYPRVLWGKYLLKKAFIASSFDKTFEGEMRKGRAVHLGALLGIRLVDVKTDGVVVKQIPYGGREEIKKGESKIVGFFGVEVMDCIGKKARLKISYRYKAWEDEVMSRLQEKYGSLTPEDMMNISRLHSADLRGMRGMCEGQEKAAMIFKIPRTEYETMSMGWFAPDQCSGIFVPVHISDTSIFQPYETGEAAEISEKLLEKFGHGNITDECKKVEKVLLRENEKVERIADKENAGRIFTISDIGMQQQAFLMQKAFLASDKVGATNAADAWDMNYLHTLHNMKDIIEKSGNNDVKKNLASVALSIASSRVSIAGVEKGTYYDRNLEKGEKLINEGKYSEGIGYLIKAYEHADAVLFGTHEESLTIGERGADYASIALGLLFAAILVFLLMRRRH